MRRAGLLLDQVRNTSSAELMAKITSDVVADTAVQHGEPLEGLMMSKVDEPGSSLPLIHIGIDMVVSLSLEEEAMSLFILVGFRYNKDSVSRSEEVISGEPFELTLLCHI